MTTQAWASVLDQSSDAAFRTWGSELNTKLAAAGLVQTSDTGQINWTTVTRAGANSDAGYEIWRFNDTQQASAPIFMKIFYGSAGTTATPRIRIQTGTASNGSGTVSGTGSANTDTLSYNGSAPSTVALFTSYLCVSDGFFGIAFKLGAGGSGANVITPHFYYAIARSTDNTGTPTADAVMQVFSTTTATQHFARTISFLTSTIYGGAGTLNWWLDFYSNTSTLVSGTPQIYKGYMTTPRVRPSNFHAVSILSEVPVGTTTTVALVGSTPHTYLASNSINGPNGTRAMMMLWE